jgi:hypothetical protein
VLYKIPQKWYFLFIQTPIYISAYLYKGEYVPEMIVENLEGHYDGFEYVDVKNDKYQLWEYPSGIIYRLQPDREMPDNNVWSLPSAGWKVTKTKISVNKDKINSTYVAFSSKQPRKSWLSKLFSRSK